jgi:Fic family protein
MQQFEIKELRRMLVKQLTLEQCEDTKDYFFSWVKEHDSTAFKLDYKSKQMVKALNEALTQAFKRDIVVQNLRMFEVKNIHFIHGMGTFEQRGRATFFYFSDLDRGMLIRADGKDYWLAVFRLIGSTEMGFSTEGQEN